VLSQDTEKMTKQVEDMIQGENAIYRNPIATLTNERSFDQWSTIKVRNCAIVLEQMKLAQIEQNASFKFRSLLRNQGETQFVKK